MDEAKTICGSDPKRGSAGGIAKCAKRFRADQRAATAIEFAFVSSILFMFVLGTLETGMCFAANMVLRDATQIAARTGRTGYVDDASTRDATVRKVVAAQARVLLDPNKLSFSSKAYSAFDQINSPEPFVDANGNGARDDGESYTDVNGNGTYDKDRGVNGFGGASQIVVYTVSYPWTFFTPLIARLFSTDGTIQLTATAVIQNEPY